MFSSKNKEKKEKLVSKTEGTQFRTQTNYAIHQTTYQRTERSVSVSYTNEQKQGFPSGSITSLPGLTTGNFLFPPSNLDREKSNSSSSSSRVVAADAKPLYSPSPRINLNYQSPYRNSPVYSSLQRPRATISTTSPAATLLPTKKVPISAPPPIREVPLKNKKLIVKKTGKFYDKEVNGVPTYQTSSKNRGEVLIINNIMFEGEHERKGAKIDHERLEDLFKQIGFKVTLKKDLKGKEMKSQVESFSKKSALKIADISVVVVMSHGTKNDVLGGTEVFGIDEKGVQVEELLQYFSGDCCKSMVNKPKIFIFQCCRGNNEQFICSDARPLSKPRPHADMLIAYSTLPGYISHRDPIEGTWYIQTICDVFSRHAHEYHVEDMLKIVDVELARFNNKVGQTSSYESRGFKRCYLHPQ